MTSALKGERVLAQNQKIVLIGCVSGTVTRQEGVKNPKFLRTSYVNCPLCCMRDCHSPAKHKRPRKSSPARISALLLQADEMTDERSEMKNIPAVQKAAAV